MVRVLGRHVARQPTQVSPAYRRQACRVKGGNRIRIGRVAEEVRWAARNGIDDIRIDLRAPLTGTGKRAESRRVVVVSVGCGDLLLVIVQTVTAAKDDPAVG